ncbi:septum formation protein [Dyella jiangningensis]|uniref:Maf family protein n=1 Tax=Dyella sp. AtDHG13 TaxID=1938897 RepID=UPI0008815AAE|nr:Maf family nucleotide pyrophosphatase [Dyella sp. AtDHG13]PXV60803.1 septum formation protein [Dyella sp. AtDHG13]SDK97466.1 septum formation protein [Dyella jiangningensis]
MSLPTVVLGSTSRYRAELLRRILSEFEQRAPGTDEAALPHETPRERALRLAVAKARAAAEGLDDALVIGSDQVAELEGVVLDKPGTRERAHAQLVASSGREVHFHTALCLHDTRTGQDRVHVDHTVATFRSLSSEEITRYIEREQPLDCAGSFKCEGLGIALFERIDNEDPSALIGLPLIALARMLREAGISLP